MGSLSEWIRVNRRAQSNPTPQPSAAPVEIPPLPSADALPEAASPLLPSRDTLLYGSLPLMLGTASGILVALGVTAAVRRI